MSIGRGIRNIRKGRLYFVLLHLNFNSKEQTLTLMVSEEKEEEGYET